MKKSGEIEGSNPPERGDVKQRNVGLRMYLMLVVVLALVAATPLIVVDFYSFVHPDIIRYFTPVTASAFPFVKLVSPVLKAMGPTALSSGFARLGFWLAIYLAYYAFMLSPLGAALMIEKGNLRGLVRRRFWMGLQAVYFIVHCVLAYVGLMLLKA